MKKQSKATKDKNNPNSSKQTLKSNQKTKPKKKKNTISKFSKPKTQVIDYFPRGAGPKNDFTTNIGIIDPSKKNHF